MSDQAKPEADASAAGEKQAASDEKEGRWLSYFDKNYDAHYYYNTGTGETTWTKPEGAHVEDGDKEAEQQAKKEQNEEGGEANVEWDPNMWNAYYGRSAKSLPFNQANPRPGTYGGGPVPLGKQTPHEGEMFENLTPGTIAGHTLEKPDETTMARPARRQVKEKKVHVRPEGADEFNIWYGKYLGNHWSKDRDPAETRLNSKLDSGFTKANLLDAKNSYICIHYAKGGCIAGAECTFLHRLPTVEDEERIDPLHDIFGRERHKAHRDDMGGVGTFNKECKSIYVGGLKIRNPHSEAERLQIEKSILTHFGEWGEIEFIRLLMSKACAILRFRYRVCAEFAREAMSDQNLDGGELLNLRWAFDDPNPQAQRVVRENMKTDALKKLEEKGACLTPADYNYPVDYRLPMAKRARVSGPEYPDTDNQYGPSVPMTQEEYERQEAYKKTQERYASFDALLSKIDGQK